MSLDVSIQWSQGTTGINFNTTRGKVQKKKKEVSYLMENCMIFNINKQNK